MYEESLALWGELRNDWGRAQILVNLALLVEGEGDLRKARSLNEQALAIMQRLGARRDSAVALRNLAGVMQEEGEYTEAARRYAEAAATTLELGDRHVLLACLEGLAILLQQRGRAACAARIFGAAEALRQEIGASVVSFDPERYAREVRSAREALGEAGFQSAWDAGQAMTRDEAVTYAVEESACEPA
jgi:tetratricopeptide (TPR) repeat protein